MDTAHIMAALRYVDLNPLRAGLVPAATKYEWSSAKAHVSGRDVTGLLEMETWKQRCPLGDWAEALEPREGDEAEARRIRRATRTGRPLGDEEFVTGLERRLGRELKRRKPGPKEKKREEKRPKIR